ncbi:hypothetical protein JKP88DRAFT_296502 [Tribonema minus]|uniref:Uncharacterized protein n=1 Tax=Tribonema minus TaxID=303371 RepID=A0A835ZB29_9STRA|nr:hypothetical protein JKP88DRAFT_296502 [Tribonema minus]
MHAADDEEKLRALKTGYLVKRPSLRKHGNGMKMWSGGKRKFFVLRGGSLTYHKDHHSVDDPTSSREILLTADCDVEYFYDPPTAPFGFCVTSRGKVLQLVAKDVMERQEWKDAISMVINQVRQTTRGYLLKRNAGGAPYVGGGPPPAQSLEEDILWTRKYFILNGTERCLTFHTDHSQALSVQGSFLLSKDTAVEKKPHNVVMLRTGDNIMVWRADNAQECQRWVTAIASVITEAKRVSSSPASSPKAAAALAAFAFAPPAREGPRNGETELSRGYLMTRVAPAGRAAAEAWVPAFFVLSAAALYRYEDEQHVVPCARLALNPNCSVFETNLRTDSVPCTQRDCSRRWRVIRKCDVRNGAPHPPNTHHTHTPHAAPGALSDARTCLPSLSAAASFELVTTSQVLHVQGSCRTNAVAWIDALKTAIAGAVHGDEDPLQVEASTLEDEMYTVTFDTKQPLGVVLERSKEWAIVKLANPQLSAISVGSALAEVNGAVVALQPYQTAITLLTGWKPPLQLVLRRAPHKSGWLKKQRSSWGKGGLLSLGTGAAAAAGTSPSPAPPAADPESPWTASRRWHALHFVLGEGRLSWFTTDTAGAKLKGTVAMMGSAVSLLPFDEAGQLNCLRVVSGITTLTLQGLTHEDMLDWAKHLYQASAVANGGGYLLERERAKQRVADEERARREQARATEQEAAERRQAEAEAQAAATAAAERAKTEAAAVEDGALQRAQHTAVAAAAAAAAAAARTEAAELAAEQAAAAVAELEFEREQEAAAAAAAAQENAARQRAMAAEVEAAMQEHTQRQATTSLHRHVLRELAVRPQSIGGGGDSAALSRAIRDDAAAATSGESGALARRVRSFNVVKGIIKVVRARRAAAEAAAAAARQAKAAAPPAPKHRPKATMLDLQMRIQEQRRNNKGAAAAWRAAASAAPTPAEEATLTGWVAAVTGEEMPAGTGLVAGLRDGRRLCRLLEGLGATAPPSPAEGAAAEAAAAAAAAAAPRRGSTIAAVRRGSVVINGAGAAAAETSNDANVAAFLRGARALGVPDADLFAESDVHTADSVALATALARALRSVAAAVPAALPDYRGPLLALPRSAAAAAAAAADSDDDSDGFEDAAGLPLPPAARREVAPALSPSAAASAAAARGEKLTDATLEQAFASLDLTAQSAHLNAMQFIALWRVLTGEQSVFREMVAFRRFDTAGDSMIDLEEFKAGFRAYEAELGTAHPIFVNLRTWADSHVVSF